MVSPRPSAGQGEQRFCSQLGERKCRTAGVSPIHVRSNDVRFPIRLKELAPPVKEIWVEGKLDAPFYVGIVGARTATDVSKSFARELAGYVCEAGACVVSGGALGIDEAAHEGALEAGGHTIAVLPTGHKHVFPREHADLFRQIAERNGGLLWPFEPTRVAERFMFHARNRVLAALCHVLVVVQARARSGALSAANYARRLQRPVWAVVTSPWEASDFAGNDELLREGAFGLRSVQRFIRELIDGGAPIAQPRAEPQLANGRPRLTKSSPRLPGHEETSSAPRLRPLPAGLTAEQKAIAEVLDGTPRHGDEIGQIAGLSPQVTATALLTLALEDVVVEGPGGFFRRT